MAKGILLEAGTNEMELLVFRLDQTPFGINVAKVREIIQRTKTITIPHAPPAVEGSFRLRDKVLTLVNLGTFFQMEGEKTQSGEGMIIVVEFNNMQCGILVDTVEVIHRLKWDEIEPPSQYLMNMNAPVTGTARVNKEIVLIADFETIISQVLGIDSATMLPEEETTEEVTKERKDVNIILADDSAILRSSLVKILNKGGFENLTVCSDGNQAWKALEELRGSDTKCDLVLSDIEMPGMDGLHLTSKIKEDSDFKDIPVVLFSSLITEDNKRKGESVGADAQISKPDSAGLIRAIEECLEKRGTKISSAETEPQPA